MNAIDLLTDQHYAADQLIAQIERTRDRTVKRQLFNELADDLAAHATIEERIFNPAIRAARTDQMLHEAVEEHLAVKRLIADMLALRTDDDSFAAKLSVMKEILEHHAHEEEEEKLFPKVRTLLDADQLDALGGEMAAMFEGLLPEQPRYQLPQQTKRAASL